MLLASAGWICDPPTPSTPRAKVSSGVLTTEYNSVPWVVKSRPWSADSGGVPATTVIVPPFLAAVVLGAELEPHAVAVTATAPASSDPAAGLRNLFIGLGPGIMCDSSSWRYGRAAWLPPGRTSAPPSLLAALGKHLAPN